MSILVKGMKMPKNSLECEYCKSGYCNKMSGRFCPGATSRPDWCPLVEIPPHGRLIEEPKQFDYSGLAYIEPLDFRKIAEYFANQVKAQPTVIEAEEGDG